MEENRLGLTCPDLKTDIKINWEGYDETESPPEAAKGNIQTAMTLMGFGKPLVESSVPYNHAVKPKKKLRQAPCEKMVHLHCSENSFIMKMYKLRHLIRFQIPPIFDGRHLVVYAILAKDAHLPKVAEVTAVSPVGPLSLKVNLNEINSQESQLIHRYNS